MVHALRRLLAVAATCCMFVGLAPVVAAASEGTADVSVKRYGGADRYEASLLVAEAFARDAGGELDWAVMVSGRSWPEVVVAASVAGVLDAPVLMTPPDGLRDPMPPSSWRQPASRACWSSTPRGLIQIPMPASASASPTHCRRSAFRPNGSREQIGTPPVQLLRASSGDSCAVPPATRAMSAS